MRAGVRRLYLSSDSYHSESKVKQGAQSVALGKLWDNFNHVMLPMSRLDALQTALVKVRGPPHRQSPTQLDHPPKPRCLALLPNDLAFRPAFMAAIMRGSMLLQSPLNALCRVFFPLPGRRLATV